jgi:hypothetical protein
MFFVLVDIIFMIQLKQQNSCVVALLLPKSATFVHVLGSS